MDAPEKEHYPSNGSKSAAFTSSTNMKLSERSSWNTTIDDTGLNLMISTEDVDLDGATLSNVGLQYPVSSETIDTTPAYAPYSHTAELEQIQPGSHQHPHVALITAHLNRVRQQINSYDNEEQNAELEGMSVKSVETRSSEGQSSVSQYYAKYAPCGCLNIATIE